MNKPSGNKKDPPALFLFIQGALRGNAWLTLFTVALLIATAAAFIFPQVLGISRDTAGLPFRIYLGVQAAAILLLFAALVNLDRRHGSVKTRLNYLSGHDGLTDLPNRSLLIKQLDELLPLLKENKQLSAFFFIGLDGIQKISDTRGLATTNTILRTISNRLLKNIRRVDVLGRIGEDEFVLVLTDIAPGQDLTGIIQKFIREISRPLKVFEQDFSIPSSIGLSFFPHNGTNAEKLIDNAHQAMLRARSRGSNQYHYYDPSLKKTAFERLELAKDLRLGMDRNEFMLFYQPQVDIQTDRIIGFEALLRWNHPTLGMISPSKFIPIAEETGLIVRMGEWAIQTACIRMKLWEEAGYEGLRVAVNLSGREFQEKNLFRMIKGTLERTGLDPRFLNLEMTEKTMQNGDGIIEKLHDLNALGLQLSVNGFGTGSSTLSFLKQFPIHTLKIDKSFIRTLTQRSDDQVIVKVIIDLAHSLGLQALAEGVETNEQLLALKDLGCDGMQGFLLSLPLAPDKMIPFLRRKGIPG